MASRLLITHLPTAPPMAGKNRASRWLQRSAFSRSPMGAVGSFILDGKPVTRVHRDNVRVPGSGFEIGQCEPDVFN